MTLSADILMHLCPMHLLLDKQGTIVQAGPTLQKLHPSCALRGLPVFDVFDVQRPRALKTMTALRAHTGRKLHLRMRAEGQPPLKGHAAPLDTGGAVLNLSFGISVVEAVKTFNLTSVDFPPTDLTIEMLYLFEAKSAAMSASRTLNMRLQSAKIAAEERAFTDTLTGLKNRRACDHVLDRMTRSGQVFSIMHLDLDYFKDVNDTMGHAAGDFVLQTVARAMVEETRKDDTVARVGGDEFVIILNAMGDKTGMAHIAHRIIERIERPISFEGRPCRISVSIGIAVHDDPTLTPAMLLEQSDLALYASKRAGRAQYRFYEPSLHDMDKE